MKISETERFQRRRWIDHSRASSGIEGIHPNKVTRDIEEAYIRGDLTNEQFLDALADLCGVPRDDHKAMAELSASLDRGEIDSDEFFRRYDAITGRDLCVKPENV